MWPRVWGRLLAQIYDRELTEYVKELAAAVDACPRYRWLRRLHLEQQMFRAEAMDCARALGYYQAWVDFRTGKVPHRLPAPPEPSECVH